MNKNGTNVSPRLQQQYQNSVAIKWADNGFVKHHYSQNSFFFLNQMLEVHFGAKR